MPGINSFFQNLSKRSISLMNHFRHRLAYADALPQLTVVGLLCGVLAAAFIILFRLAIDIPLTQILSGNSENFEVLSPIWRFLLPTLGGAVIGIFMYFIKEKYHDISVSHVLERLHQHQGFMPKTNFMVQFIGGVLCLLSGQSLGREGPAVHIGAAAASQFGRWLKLPHNSLRTLIACGVAAAIAASFNTPMAGVIFAMEVVLMEYTIIGFIPVILASVSGAIAAQIVFGHESFFYLTETKINSLWELPYLVFAGLIIAACAAIYIRLIITFSQFQRYPIYIRLTAAGAITGLLAIFVPQILGMGYDTISSALLGELGLILLIIIIGTKTLATTISVGLGMPAGLIGPCLVIGACLGAAIGTIGDTLLLQSEASISFYVILGMVAMMGAVLNAPLAALIAILELSSNPNIIFPGMLIIVVACFATRQFFHCDGIFQEQLKIAGKPIHHEPTQQLLSKIGVRSVMNTSFAIAARHISISTAQQLLETEPLWLVIKIDAEPEYILRASSLAGHLETLSEQSKAHEEPIDLIEIPGERLSIAGIDERANLYAAQILLNQNEFDMLYVYDQANPSSIFGIITHETILNRYKP